MHRRHRGPTSLLLLLVGCLALGPASRPVVAEDEPGILVEGVEGAMLSNVQAFVGLLSASAEDLGDAKVRRRLVSDAADEVALALTPFGFYHAEVEVFSDESGYPERLVVDPGPPTLVSTLQIVFENAELPSKLEERLHGLMQLAVGKRLDHATYEDGKRAIQSALHDAGRLRVKLLENQVLVDRSLNTAEIRLRWDAGPEHYFGPVRFVGSQFDDGFMARYVNIEPGQPYRKRALTGLTQNLMDSPFFMSAEVLPRMDEVSEDLRVPIRVRITPMKLNLFGIGISAGTDSGLGLEGLYERRWLNRKGHSFRTQLSPSVDRSTFTAVYSMPARYRLDRVYSVGIDALDETTKSNEKQNVAYSVLHQRIWRKWRRTGSVRYLDEDFVAGGEPGSSALLLLQGSFSRAKPRNKLVPPAGWSLNAGFKLASDSVASDTSLIQIDLLGRGILSFSESWRLLNRLQLGVTWVDDFALLPASLRYYAGGDRSLRGYAFESLGPRNEQGLVTGGENLMIVSTEIERSLSDLLRLAAFVDYGNAINDFGDELEAGAGIGARLATPIGMIRLDVAYPLTVDDGKVRLHFTVGPDL